MSSCLLAKENGQNKTDIHQAWGVIQQAQLMSCSYLKCKANSDHGDLFFEDAFPGSKIGLLEV